MYGRKLQSQNPRDLHSYQQRACWVSAIIGPKKVAYGDHQREDFPPPGISRQCQDTQGMRIKVGAAGSHPITFPHLTTSCV